MRIVGMALLLVGVAGFAFGGFTLNAPEIDASSGGSAIALLSGGLLIIRARRKK